MYCSTKGGDIRIISCRAGAKTDGAAKQLADELGVNVLAPTETVNIDEKGRVFITDNEFLAEMWYEAEDKSMFTETGKWIVFKPKRR